MTKKLVSVLIVAHNPGNYFSNTITSCLEQTYDNLEILILDNNSSENILQYFKNLEGFSVYAQPQRSEKEKSFDVVNIYNQNNIHIRIFHKKENFGPYRGLNLLLQKANWDYVAIQDHDDIWHKNKIKTQVAFLEENHDFVGCGTKTIMYYESDKKYFEYFLWEKNYYTIHPSLVFRNAKNLAYDTTKTEYMADALFMKKILCKNEKKIFNINQSLTLHVIKKWNKNYSYKWHKLNCVDINQVYEIHPPLYATMTLGWEIMRKIFYPIFNILFLGFIITKIERLPFFLLGYRIKKTTKENWWHHLFFKEKN